MTGIKISDINKHNTDLFVMGDDWKEKFNFLKPHCEVVYLEKRQGGVSTTDIKEDIKEKMS